MRKENEQDPKNEGTKEREDRKKKCKKVKDEGQRKSENGKDIQKKATLKAY